MFDDDARRLRQWDGRCSRATWVSLIARSVALDWVRAERRRERRLDRAADPGLIPHPVETIDDRAEEIVRLRQAVEALPDPDRTLIHALVIEDRPAAEVASELGVALGTLYTRKSRALEKLRAAFTALTSGKVSRPADVSRGGARAVDGQTRNRP
jgi:RNA polymerase sigma-70 factor (ECF subfamily)